MRRLMLAAALLAACAEETAPDPMPSTGIQVDPPAGDSECVDECDDDFGVCTQPEACDLACVQRCEKFYADCRADC